MTTCALVCHQWYGAARPLMYETVTIYNATRAQELYEMIGAAPIIGQWIKEISFDLLNHDIEDPENVDIDPNWLGADVFMRLEGRLPSLRCISFIATHHDDICHAALFDALSRFRTVRHVSSYLCHHTATFLTFLSRFPLLETLSLKRSTFSIVDLTGFPPNLSLPHLSDLHVTGCSNNQHHVRAWLNSAITASSLRSLTVDVRHEYYVEETNELLKNAGSNLQFLDIKFPLKPEYPNASVGMSCPPRRDNGWPPASREVVMERIDLRHNTGLRGLTIYTPDSPEFVGLLDQVSGSRIRTVDIVLQLSRLPRMKREDYEALDERLVRSDFRHLEEVHVVCEGLAEQYDLSQNIWESIDSVTCKVHQLFPSVSNRGILRVTTG